VQQFEQLDFAGTERDSTIARDSHARTDAIFPMGSSFLAHGVGWPERADAQVAARMMKYPSTAFKASPFTSTGLESPVNRQAGKPALRSTLNPELQLMLLRKRPPLREAAGAFCETKPSGDPVAYLIRV